MGIFEVALFWSSTGCLIFVMFLVRHSWQSFSKRPIHPSWIPYFENRKAELEAELKAWKEVKNGERRKCLNG